MEKTRVVISDVYVLDLRKRKKSQIFGETCFGRADADLNFPKDKLISRKHFRLLPVDDAVLIEDLGSTNTTRVNGKRLRASTMYKLRSRDVIQFGQQKFQIHIGGKVVADTKTTVAPEPGAESSMVFERFLTVSPPEPSAAALAAARGGQAVPTASVGLEIDREGMQHFEQAQADSFLRGLLQKKESVWYLQFAGSEFGPLSLRELNTIVASGQLKGSALFAFTDGLEDWLPVEAIMKFVDEVIPPARTGAGQGEVELAGSVVCHADPAQKAGIQGKLSAALPAGLRVVLNAPLPTKEPFDVDVLPLPSTGIGAFRAKMKGEAAYGSGNACILTWVEAPAHVKIAFERYLRARKAD